MTETQYTRMMAIYAVMLVVSYSLFLFTSGSVQMWSLIVALWTAITGLFRALQRPYQTSKEQQDEESRS